MPSYAWKQRGPDVARLQEALIDKGFKLPKYGIDGELSGETWTAVEAFAHAEQFSTAHPLPVAVTDAILAPTPSRVIIHPFGYVRVKGDPADVHGQRRWADVTTIVLHQTGCWMTDTPERFRTLNAHVGILAAHKTPIVQVQELNAYMYHANQANKFSVGIEINGHFPGLATGFDPKVHSGDGPTRSQIETTCLAVRWICEEVAEKGGEIKYILPHRVSNDSRRSDPGEIAWKRIGIWAQKTLGLSDMGAGWSIGDGKPIPGTWDDRSAYQKYKF